ncbi:hypothetical protein P5673_020842 [Acropora cervicornis]|uniref:Uncharacterized protein n=1 Tax=Acropora cervicornis TaxID=6130 RepID=A0AAD9V0S4_ACRCE|nr:hypothetical protein P5673_020842 [Acropora cervicornis]
MPWTSYQFLGLFKKQSHKTKSWQLNAHIAAKVYLRRLSVIWSSHLLDINCVRARKQFAMIVQTYLRWSQQLPNTELWAIDREATKIICEEGGKHLLSSTLVTHLHKYKLMEIKAAMKILQNMEPFIWGVQQFEERTGLTSLMKEAHNFAEKLKTSLSLEYPE